MAELLRIPANIRSVEDCLGVAEKMDLGHCLVLSELPDGMVILHATNSGEPLNQAQIIWLLERARFCIVSDGKPEFKT